MRNYKYVTNRTLPNKAGELDKGNVRVLVPNDSDTAQVAYKCPECGNQEQLKQPWKRPFSVRCSKCSYLMKLPKLKGKKK
jgi:peptide subunit release factor 1 (eRF1)